MLNFDLLDCQGGDSQLIDQSRSLHRFTQIGEASKLFRRREVCGSRSPLTGALQRKYTLTNISHQRGESLPA
jgi:hypothetical protein